MEEQSNKIECPHCGNSIDVNDILYHQVNEKLKKEYEEQLDEEKNKYQIELKSIKEQRKELEQQKKKQDEIVNNAIKSGLAEKEKILKAEIKSEIELEQSENTVIQ